jgi:hypothetical protein
VTSRPCRFPAARLVLNTYGIVMHTACIKAWYGVLRTHPQITSCALSSAGGAAYLPARPHGRKEALTCGGDRGSRALASLGHRCRVSDVDWGRRPRRGPPFRRAPLLQLPQRGALASRSRRLDAVVDTVCTALREPGPISPSPVTETLANGLAADPLSCDQLANTHLHFEQEVISTGLSRSGGPAPLPKSCLRMRSGRRCRRWSARTHQTSFLRPAHWRPIFGISPTRRRG